MKTVSSSLSCCIGGVAVPRPWVSDPGFFLCDCIVIVRSCISLNCVSLFTTMKTEVLRGRNLVHYSSVDSERHRMEALSVLHHEKNLNCHHRRKVGANPIAPYFMGASLP